MDDTLNKKKTPTQVLRDLKADLKASDLLRKEHEIRISKWINEYEGKPYGNEVKNKSQIVSRDIKKQDEWLHPSILDPFVATPDIIKARPVTYEDDAAAKQSEALLNYQFCRQFNRFNFMSKAIKILSKEGTVVIQTGWDYEDMEVEEEVPVIESDFMGNEVINGTTTATRTKIMKNQPTAVVCRNQDVYIDPTCMDDMDKCQFIIHRYETDYSTLKQDGRYKNLDKAMQSGMADPFYQSDYFPTDKTYFRFSDEARKKVMVYEYWGNYDVNGDGIAEPIVCAWIGDTIIRLQSNPYPDKKPPFIVVPFNSVPFQIYGESDAESISDNQKIKTAITRGIIDNMAQSNNGQVGMRKGALDAFNRKKFQEGKNFEFNGTPGDFWYGNYNPIPNSAFDMLTMMNNEIESLTAVKSFSGGISGSSLGGTATGARGALDATGMRRMYRVRNIAENLVKPLMRKWLAYSNEFLEEEQVIRITNSEFVNIRKDDLVGNIDIDIEVSTAEDNASKAQELSFMLQTLGQTMEPEMRNYIMAEIARLHQMPVLEKQLREWKPQPDPMREQLKQLELQNKQLENQLLQAEIKDRLVRAGENEIDTQLKKMKVQVEASKARKLSSEADNLDLNFLESDSGIGHQRDMEKENFRRLSKLDTIAAQAMAGEIKKQGEMR